MKLGWFQAPVVYVTLHSTWASNPLTLKIKSVELVQSGHGLNFAGSFDPASLLDTRGYTRLCLDEGYAKR